MSNTLFYNEPEFEIQIWNFLNRQDKRENEGVLVAASLCDINAMLMYSNGLCSACRRERALKKSALVHQ